MKTSNQKCRELVIKRIPFKAHNLFAEQRGDKYIVYSYGYHWPMHVFYDGRWFINSDKYSVSTSKQHGQSFPIGENVSYLTINEMKKLIEFNMLPEKVKFLAKLGLPE